MNGEPRGFSQVEAEFSSYDGDLSLPLGLALGSPIFPSGCEGMKIKLWALLTNAWSPHVILPFNFQLSVHLERG